MRSLCVAHDGRLKGCTIDVVMGMRVRDKRTRLWFCARVGRVDAGNRQRGLRERDGGEHCDYEFRHVPDPPGIVIANIHALGLRSYRLQRSPITVDSAVWVEVGVVAHDVTSSIPWSL